MVESSAAIRRGHPITFGIFTGVAFIVAVIASTLVADYNQNNNAPTMGINNATRFLLFAGWWGFLVGVIYVSIFPDPWLLRNRLGSLVSECSRLCSIPADTASARF